MAYNGAGLRKKNLHRENRVTDEFLIKIKNLKHTKDLEPRPRVTVAKRQTSKKHLAKRRRVLLHGAKPYSRRKNSRTRNPYEIPLLAQYKRNKIKTEK